MSQLYRCDTTAHDDGHTMLYAILPAANSLYSFTILIHFIVSIVHVDVISPAVSNGCSHNILMYIYIYTMYTSAWPAMDPWRAQNCRPSQAGRRRILRHAKRRLALLLPLSEQPASLLQEHHELLSKV